MRLAELGAMGMAACSSAVAQAPVQTPLNLTCFGGGNAKKFTVVGGSSSGSFSGEIGTTPISGTVNGTSSVVIPRNEEFSDQVDVRLFGGDDRIRLPGTTIPAFHGGQNGWFRLKDVIVDQRSIHAKVLVNFMNHPSVHIDRVTGIISISGKSGDYTGQCEAIQDDAPMKF